MKNKLIAALAASTALLLSNCATRMSNDPTAPTGPPDATVSMDLAQASYWGSAGAGGGTLRYQGRSHPISVKMLGGGGLGAQSINATGKVYHLNSLAALPGTYTGARSGLTLVNGVMHSRLENDKGTVIYLTGKTTGLSTSFGIDKVLIELK
ncbi:MAG: hypothetical protein RLZZ522_703 [Verrucomicrobiota bacterium]|jgi:hypothetical protein